MDSSHTVLAIDQGTSGTKALVVCAERGVIASAEAEVHPHYGPHGAVEIDPMALLHSVLDTGRRAVDEAAEPIDCIALANQGETVLAWDPATGTPLTPALVWQDRRATADCDELREHAARLAAVTGLPLDAYFAAPKMRWIRRHLTTRGVVTTSDTWLVHQLTGAFVTDTSTASRTLLLDLDTLHWSDEALETFGLTGERLPAVVHADDVHGETQDFGGSAVPVTGLLVDQQAALLAQRCLQAGAAKCTFGTGAFLLANSGPGPRRSSAGLSASVAWRLHERTDYCLDGQVYTLAATIRWLTSLGVISGAHDLDRLGAATSDSGGVVFVPALAGLAAPWWRRDVRGNLSGLTLETSPGNVVRALCEGVAAQVAELLAAVTADLGTATETLKVDGGLTRSQLLMQTHADVLQMPVEVHASPHATALGAAAVALLGVDARLNLHDVVPPSDPAAVYEPRISADEAEKRRADFRAAVDALIDTETI